MFSILFIFVAFVNFGNSAVQSIALFHHSLQVKVKIQIQGLRMPNRTY